MPAALPSGLALALVLALGWGPSGCGRAPVAPEPACTELVWDGDARRRSVVLVLNDTMRRDRIGSYGGPARTPVFDRFARENLLFAAAITQAPWTKPSIATLFTGLYPSQHGVQTHPPIPLPGRPRGRSLRLETDVLSEGLTTLAEVMQGAGYQTAAFVANPWLQEEYGFGQGFELWDESFAAFDTPGEVVTRAALDWLEERDDPRPFFLYLHYIDSHGPYPGVSAEELRRLQEAFGDDTRILSDPARASLRAAVRLPDGEPAASAGIDPSVGVLKRVYDKGLEQFDRALGELLAGLDAGPGTGRGDDPPAVIVTTDHGEALFERGWGSHGHGLFDDEVAIPLAARLPGVGPPGPVGCPVGLVDVMATLCVYLGLACPDHDFGVSWLAPPGAADERPARYLVTESVIAKPRHRAIRNRDYKLLFEPDGRRGAPPALEGEGYALFAPLEDPGEGRDLIGEPVPESRYEAVFRVLSAASPEAVPDFDAPERLVVPVDAQTRERLKELGYLDEEP